ncbi:MAG: 4-alpha-glucanotransferase [Rhodospirillales bacterium]|nr:4-alpha-glucanotransferase [Rhodospirillales bacterium]
MNGGDEAAIERLAELAGIEPGYRDTEGTYRRISPETRRAVLSVLGHDANRPAAVRDAVAAREEAPWDTILPPVVVLRPVHGAAPCVAAVVSDAAAAGRLAWRIALEDGSARRGVEALADAAVLAQRPGRSGGRRRVAVTLPADLPLGYHRLEVEARGCSGAAVLVQAPAQAWLPGWLAEGARGWAVGCPLFALWSARSWGIGDFSDLARLTRLAQTLGARLVGLNPLHAPLPGAIADPNPYQPSSRRFLNPLHIDVTALASAGSGAARPGRRLPEAARGIDYPLVHEVKHAALAAAYQARNREEVPADLDAFRRDGGAALERFALFTALAEAFAPRPWHDWPTALRGPAAPGIAAFRREHRDRSAYHVWLQWIADRQLAAVAADAGAARLYRDLAIGVHPDGADVWDDPGQFLTAARFGAPPDAFNPEGQNWGLPPPDPVALRAGAYGSYVAAVRANMRHATALRIDHVMGLERLYVVASGGSAREGAYLRYPRDDLLGILALESHRNRCLLVGEDLGTLPDGFHEHMAAAGLLSCRLMLFERWPNGLFRRPGTYPGRALAAFGTHDLPTVRGWWQGCDLPPGPGADADAVRRAQDRVLLLAALRDRGLVSDGEVVAATDESAVEATESPAVEATESPAVEATESPAVEATDDPDAIAALLRALHRFLASSPAALVLANLGDLLAETEQINRPGVIDAKPNWRHRYRLPLEALAEDRLLRAIAADIAAARAAPADTEP